MRDSKFFVNNLWRDLAGLPEIEPVVLPPLERLRETQWSRQFEKLMRNRLVCGAIRYGLMYESGKKKYDRLKSIEKRLAIYRETGNTETLVDIANLCLLEFEEGEHPLKHFRAFDDKHHVSSL